MTCRQGPYIRLLITVFLEPCLISFFWLLSRSFLLLLLASCFGYSPCLVCPSWLLSWAFPFSPLCLGCHLPVPSACEKLNLHAGSPCPPPLTCSSLLFFPTEGPLIHSAAHRTAVHSPLMNVYWSIKRNLFKLHEKNQQTCLALFGFLLFCFLWPDGLNQGWKCPRFPDLSSTDSL